MYLIVGLGNVGDKYKKTRHNIGFMVIDKMTKSLATSNINKTEFKSVLLKSQNNLFAKPTTFMNNSGVAIISIANYFNIPNEKIIVIHDDLDLPFGAIKFKLGGGHGGHNGLKSLDSHIGKDYIRVRIGISKPQDKGQVASWVLSDFSKDEFDKLDDIISHCIKAIEDLQKTSLEYIKSTYTKKS
jgi:PTH1 family peptidyl-tRNA hydrolase